LALGADGHGLFVAVRRQGNVGGESGGVGNDLEIAVAAMSLDISVDAAAAFAPCALERAVLGDHIAFEIEFIAVAGAGQGLIETRPIRSDRVRRAAPDSLRRSVV